MTEFLYDDDLFGASSIPLRLAKTEEGFEARSDHLPNVVWKGSDEETAIRHARFDLAQRLGRREVLREPPWVKELGAKIPDYGQKVS